MGRLSAFLLALFLAGAGAVTLASCGGDSDAKLLPGTTANQIESNLDQVDQLVESGDCVGAENAVAEVTAEVEELDDVATKLKAALREGTAKLSEVVGRCEEEAPEEETEPSPEEDVEAEELESEELAAEEKAAEKAEKLQEKEEEKAQEETEVSESEEGTSPPPSDDEGIAEGHEEAPPPAASAPAPAPAQEAPAGGVSPGMGVE
jgi:hypothetical protein